MDGLMISIFVLMGSLIGFFIAYATTTSRIIKDQDKKIARLRYINSMQRIGLKNLKQENAFLKSTLEENNVQVIAIYEQPKDFQIPKFND